MSETNILAAAADDIVAVADQMEEQTARRPDAITVNPADLTLGQIALLQQQHLYADTTPDQKVADRRRRNKAARKSRRTNRIARKR